MKKLLYIFITLFIISCANNKKEAAMDAVESVEMEQNKTTILESTAIEDMSGVFQYQQITTQKLQDYFDLSILQQQHPEFKEEITTQLQELSKDILIIADSTQQVIIENVQQLSEIQRVSDSVQKIKIRFDIRTNNSVKNDSITAIITTKKIRLDDKEVISTKILFERIE